MGNDKYRRSAPGDSAEKLHNFHHDIPCLFYRPNRSTGKDEDRLLQGTLKLGAYAKTQSTGKSKEEFLPQS
jgi:hypothetical protein